MIVQTLDRPTTREVDSFARVRLPPAAEWPELDLSHPAYRYPARLNCVTEFLDRWVAEGAGERLAFVTPAERWSYRRLFETVNASPACWSRTSA
jgi:2-aminobenzoate-CoA ligase